MTDRPLLLDELPRAVSLPRRGRGRRLPISLVWLVPAIAALLGAWLAGRALWLRGPTITITFATAEGLEANRTTIKYKSVDIGVIKTIELLEDRSGVVVTAELSRRAEKLLVEDARFWVVRPRVSLAGVSGIGTLLTGSHIGFDAGVSPVGRRSFTGLEAPPSTISDRRGRRFVLRAESAGSLDLGSPIYLRRLQVGQVTGLALERRGTAVMLEAFIDAPYDQQVRGDTRFWNASGVDLTVNTRGIKLDTQSLASVLVGGIAFQTPSGSTGAPPAAPGAEFRLYAGQEAALRHPAGTDNNVQVVFTGPAHGLTAGASVELLGIDVGEVSEVTMDFDPLTMAPRTVVDLCLHPDRLRLRGEVPSKEASRPLLATLVARGLRAQLRTENMLTGQRYVAFELVPQRPKTKPATIDWTAVPVVLPSDEGAGDDLQGAMTRLMAKLEKVPLADLAKESALAAQEMRKMFEGTSRLVSEVAPKATALMGQSQKTLAAVEQTLSGDAPLQQDLRSTLRDLSGAGVALRSLAEYLERHPESLLRGKKGDRP
jgi:paraquat-inducible protein B